MDIKIILSIIGAIISLAGVTLIFDARIITKKVFSFGDQNEGTAGLKIIGFIIGIIGAIIVFYNVKVDKQEKNLKVDFY